MAREKNALRGHFLQKYIPGTETPGKEWSELAEWITDINDATVENEEETAYYNGDGTPENEVISVAGAYDVEGTYDPEDAAQTLIADMKYKTGNGRKVWHKVVSANGEKQWVGRATVSAIVAGSGNAAEYEAFSCTIRYDKIPEESEVEVSPEG